MPAPTRDMQRSGGCGRTPSPSTFKTKLPSAKAGSGHHPPLPPPQPCARSPGKPCPCRERRWRRPQAPPRRSVMEEGPIRGGVGRPGTGARRGAGPRGGRSRALQSASEPGPCGARSPPGTRAGVEPRCGPGSGGRGSPGAAAGPGLGEGRRPGKEKKGSGSQRPHPGLRGAPPGRRRGPLRQAAGARAGVWSGVPDLARRGGAGSGAGSGGPAYLGGEGGGAGVGVHVPAQPPASGAGAGAGQGGSGSGSGSGAWRGVPPTSRVQRRPAEPPPWNRTVPAGGAASRGAGRCRAGARGLPGAVVQPRAAPRSSAGARRLPGAVVLARGGCREAQSVENDGSRRGPRATERPAEGCEAAASGEVGSERPPGRGSRSLQRGRGWSAGFTGRPGPPHPHAGSSVRPGPRPLSSASRDRAPAASPAAGHEAELGPGARHSPEPCAGGAMAPTVPGCAAREHRACLPRPG